MMVTLNCGGFSLDGLRAWKSRLLQVLTEGIERGEVASGTAPVRVVNTVIAILEGSLLISRIERTSTAMEDARVHLDTLFDGLVPTGRQDSGKRRAVV